MLNERQAETMQTLVLDALDAAYRAGEGIPSQQPTEDYIKRLLNYIKLVTEK